MWIEIVIQLHLASCINVVIYILDNSEKLAVFQFWKQTLLFKKDRHFLVWSIYSISSQQMYLQLYNFFPFCFSVSLHTSSKLAPLSISKAASSTCPPQAARVRGDSKESAGMLTCAPLSNSSRATSTWPSWDSETHREYRDKHLNKYTYQFLVKLHEFKPSIWKSV